MGKESAVLTTIGTAQFGGKSDKYKLIWDRDISVVWLDYTPEFGSDRINWAKTLKEELTLEIDSAYLVDWEENDWRLPVVSDKREGYNITKSEMGHLFYEALGNKGRVTIDGIELEKDEYGLKNKGEFENLVETWYWSGTEYDPDIAYIWGFNMGTGHQITYGGGEMGYDRENRIGHCLLAVRSGKVTKPSLSAPKNLRISKAGGTKPGK